MSPLRAVPQNRRRPARRISLTSYRPVTYAALAEFSVEHDRRRPTMDVLVTGCDTDLGRTIAERFSDAGHNVALAGSRRDDLEVVAKELEVSNDRVIVFDNTDPASIAAVHGQFPAHLDTIVNVPVPRLNGADPRTYTLADHVAEWHSIFDNSLLSAVL